MHAPFARSHARRGFFTTVPLAGLLLLAALLLAGCQSEETYSSQGTQASPLDLGTVPVSYDEGSVGPEVSSYYKVGGVTEGSTYTISLTGLTDDADLIVFTDSGFTNVFCASVKAGNASEVCANTVVVSSGVTTLYIQVKPHTTTGTAYLLSVS